MKAEVSDDRYADHRQDPQCPCRSCRRHAALRGAGPSLVNGFEPPQHPDGFSHPQPRHPDSGQFLSPPHPEDGSRDARGRFLSPADRVDGWSLDNMR
jgi:hypothetical protein